VTTLDVFHGYGEEIEKGLRLRTSPIAVKLLEKEADIPEGAKRPVRDFGYHLALCQAFAMSRRQGTVVAMLKEDMWCFFPVIGYGLAEPPKYFLDGHSCYPDVMTLEACKKWAQAYPRLQTGKYIGVVSAPLMTANFEPDLVIIYCDSAQLSALLLGLAYKDGRDITCRLTAETACVYSVAPAIQSGECQVALPCGGDRIYAGARDDEMVFAVPKGKVEDLMLGLRQILDKLGFRGLSEPLMVPEWELPEPYVNTAKMLGMGVGR